MTEVESSANSSSSDIDVGEKEQKLEFRPDLSSI